MLVASHPNRRGSEKLQLARPIRLAGSRKRVLWEQLRSFAPITIRCGTMTPDEFMTWVNENL
jgi:hypothetical protein